MEKQIKDIILLTIARAADIGTTYLCFSVFGNDLAIEGGLMSRLLIQSWGFIGLIAFNVLTIVLLGLAYNRVKKIRIGWIMRAVAIISFIFATYNLLVYLSAIK